MLLAHWKQAGHEGWTLPGGGLEAGEEPEEAAIREIEEETGYDAVLEGRIGIDSRMIPTAERITPASTPLLTVRVVYRARVVGGQLRNELDGSTDRAAWFPLAEVPDLRRVGLVDVALRFAGLVSAV